MVIFSWDKRKILTNQQTKRKRKLKAKNKIIKHGKLRERYLKKKKITITVDLKSFKKFLIVGNVSNISGLPTEEIGEVKVTQKTENEKRKRTRKNVNFHTKVSLLFSF